MYSQSSIPEAHVKVFTTYFSSSSKTIVIPVVLTGVLGTLVLEGRGVELSEELEFWRGRELYAGWVGQGLPASGYGLGDAAAGDTPATSSLHLGLVHVAITFYPGH